MTSLHHGLSALIVLLLIPVYLDQLWRAVYPNPMRPVTVEYMLLSAAGIATGVGTWTL